MSMTDKAKTQAWLAWSLLASLVVIILMVLVIPALDARQKYHEQKENNQFLIHKLQQTLAEDKARSPDLAPQETTNWMFTTRSDALLAAEIQTILSRLVNDEQGGLISVQTANPEASDSFNKVSLMVHLRTDIAGLLTLLETLANHRPLLIMENPDIRVLKNQSHLQADVEGNETLDVHFKLSGFYQQAG